MKIILVLTPNLFKRCPLIGLAYLSTFLKAHNYEVNIFDLNTEMEIPYEAAESTWSNIEFVDSFISENKEVFEFAVKKILETKAEIIGFSAWATTKYVSLALAEMIKQQDRNKLIVFGGPECSFSSEELIANDAVDILVCGEGEQTLVKIVEAYKKFKKINFCPGAVIKNNGRIINCNLRPEIENLDSIPFADFSDFALDKYYLPNNLPIVFYRGCSRRCVFCNASVIWKRFRSRSPENIYKEMVFQKKLFPNLRKFEVDDTALNLDLKLISHLCDLIIANDLRIDWGGPAIIHSGMNLSLLRKMAKAGCTSLAYGLESGSQNVIDKMRKNFKVEDAERLIRDTHCAGIKVDLNIIIGFPNETEYDFRQTMDFVKRNRGFISFVSFPSECWIGNQTYLHTHPEEFCAKLSKAGHLWQTEDGINTHEERQRRIKIFNDFINSLGLSLHNYASTTREIRASIQK